MNQLLFEEGASMAMTEMDGGDFKIKWSRRRFFNGETDWF
jgi:hypothetical protein